MTTNHLNMGVEPVSEGYISSIPQTMDNVQRSIPVMNQPLSHTFGESKKCVLYKIVILFSHATSGRFFL
jgi:hypothetical protein